MLILTPFLFYSYRLFSKESQEWVTPFFTMSSGGFQNIQYFIHALYTKLLLCIPFTIWFLTCRHWWRYAILVPLTMCLFQLTGVINHQIQFLDEYDFWWSLPAVAPIIIFLVILANRMRFYRIGIDLREQLEAEISQATGPTQDYAHKENS